MYRYSEGIMRAVRQSMGLSEDNVSRDNDILQMPKDEVFRRILAAHGFAFYERSIKQWIKEIWGIDLNTW